MKAISFSAAGFKIKLQSEHPELLALEDGYIPFVVPVNFDDADVLIQAEKNLPDAETNEKNLLFEANLGQQKFFSIYTEGSMLKFIVFDQSADNKIQQVAFLDKDFTKWTVHTGNAGLPEKIFPLKYPLGPIVLYYLTLKYDAIMIHASGVYDGVKGRLFTGFSGRGKSTIASLWHQAGSDIINDDRLILRCENDKIFMYNTPMFYPDIPKKAPLDSLHIISHANENRMNRIDGAAAISKVLAFCIQHNYNPVYIEHHLTVISNICKHISVFDVGFKPDISIVDHIKRYAN